MIAVIDIQIGNIGSVSRALKFLKANFLITNKKEDIEKADKLIFPGVGSFSEAAKKLEESGLKEIIRKRVLEDKIPILGICLGMQLFAKKGFEFGESDGFGFVDSNVVSIRSEKQGFKMPHMGWNDLNNYDLKMLDGVKPESCFYFVHSYEMIFNSEEGVKIAKTDYGVDVVAAFEKNNIYGAQFHPEKSQEVGLQILRNFCEKLC